MDEEDVHIISLQSGPAAGSVGTGESTSKIKVNLKKDEIIQMFYLMKSNLKIS